MAFIHLQGTQNATAGASSLATTVTATTKDSIVVVTVRFLDTSKTVSSVTDDKGNTYTKAYGPRDYNTVRQYQYYARQITEGATSITVTLSSSTSMRVQVAEFSVGTGKKPTYDKSANTGGVGTDANVAIAPTNNGELVVACIGRNVGGSSITPQNSYVSSVTTTSMDTIYKLSATESETPRLTWTTSSDWVIIASAFIEEDDTPPVTETHATVFGDDQLLY